MKTLVPDPATAEIVRLKADLQEALALIEDVRSWLPTIVDDDEELEELTDKIEAILEKRK